MVDPSLKPAPVQCSEDHATLGQLRSGAMPIYVHESVLEAALDHSESDPSRELGGFLIGGLHEDERTYVEVRHFVPAIDAQSRAASLTFTHQTWARLNQEVQARFSDELVVGWHHTHPKFGVFLSAYDLFIHRHFFDQPWQIALVVDPLRREFGFFQWHHGDIVDCGFVCVKQ
jgi:proteasome lid subunit RPN8/RPN11